jgi:D-sedoheptulose 7-phosphate isomerase
MIRGQLADVATLVAQVSEELADSVDRYVDMVLATFRGGGKVLFCGNGGSAADAQHIAAEYVVRFMRRRDPLPAVALTTDSSILTASGNDLGFDTVFERQVRALGRSGDLLVMHSTSGESENLVRAAGVARDSGLATVGLLAKGGGRLRDLVDLSIVIPTESTARAQEMHMVLEHIVCDRVDRTTGEGQ